MIRTELLAAAVLMGGGALFLLALFSVALARGLAWRRRANSSAAVAPAIRDALADYLAGSNDASVLRGFMRSSRGDVAGAILALEGTASGGARNRLCELALDLALVHD
jgi:hypothetical protein